MNLLTQILIISGGGALGALSRAGVGALVAMGSDTGALKTLAANFLGCLFIGAARAAVDLQDWGSAQQRLFLFTGFLGAFTTFSTFEADSIALWQDGQRGWALLYSFGSVLGGLCMYAMGWYIARKVMS